MVSDFVVSVKKPVLIKYPLYTRKFLFCANLFNCLFARKLLPPIILYMQPEVQFRVNNNNTRVNNNTKIQTRLPYNLSYENLSYVLTLKNLF